MSSSSSYSNGGQHQDAPECTYSLYAIYHNHLRFFVCTSDVFDTPSTNKFTNQAMFLYSDVQALLVGAKGCHGIDLTQLVARAEQLVPGYTALLLVDDRIHKNKDAEGKIGPCIGTVSGIRKQLPAISTCELLFPAPLLNAIAGILLAQLKQKSTDLPFYESIGKIISSLYHRTRRCSWHCAAKIKTAEKAWQTNMRKATLVLPPQREVSVDDAIEVEVLSPLPLPRLESVAAASSAAKPDEVKEGEQVEGEQVEGEAAGSAPEIECTPLSVGPPPPVKEKKQKKPKCLSLLPPPPPPPGPPPAVKEKKKKKPESVDASPSAAKPTEADGAPPPSPPGSPIIKQTKKKPKPLSLSSPPAPTMQKTRLVPRPGTSASTGESNNSNGKRAAPVSDDEDELDHYEQQQIKLLEHTMRERFDVMTKKNKERFEAMTAMCLEQFGNTMRELKHVKSTAEHEVIARLRLAVDERDVLLANARAEKLAREAQVRQAMLGMSAVFK